MMLFLWQAASSVAHAANTQAAAWSAEEWRDILVGVIGAMWLGFTSWQNQVLKKQNDEIKAQIALHEERATMRARLRGDLPVAGASDERPV